MLGQTESVKFRSSCAISCIFSNLSAVLRQEKEHFGENMLSYPYLFSQLTKCYSVQGGGWKVLEGGEGEDVVLIRD